MALIICGGTALDICGNFCGPTWCDGAATAVRGRQSVKGAACVKSAGDCSESKATDGSCADACCRKHDTCCGSTDRRPCNTEIVSCLEQCGGMSGDDDLPSCYSCCISVGSRSPSWPRDGHGAAAVRMLLSTLRYILRLLWAPWG